MPQLSRRGFLRLAGTSAALTALAQLRGLPPEARAHEPGAATFFSPGETEILTQVVERMVETGVPGAPAVRQTRAIPTLDALCRTLDPEIGGQLSLVLQLFEYGPFFFDLTFSRFTRMSAAEQDESLRAWMTSRLAIRRRAFYALRNLAFLGYYSQDASWPLIGYAGPLIPARGNAS